MKIKDQEAAFIRPTGHARPKRYLVPIPKSLISNIVIEACGVVMTTCDFKSLPREEKKPRFKEGSRIVWVKE